MKRRADPGKGYPLGHRFQIVEGLVRLDFDHAVQSASAIVRREDKIGEQRPDAESERRRRLAAEIHPNLVSAAPARVEQTDHPIMFELLTDRTHQNRTQNFARVAWIRATHYLVVRYRL